MNSTFACALTIMKATEKSRTCFENARAVMRGKCAERRRCGRGGSMSGRGRIAGKRGAGRTGGRGGVRCARSAKGRRRTKPEAGGNRRSGKAIPSTHCRAMDSRHDSSPRPECANAVRIRAGLFPTRHCRTMDSRHDSRPRPECANAVRASFRRSESFLAFPWKQLRSGHARRRIHHSARRCFAICSSGDPPRLPPNRLGRMRRSGGRGMPRGLQIPPRRRRQRQRSTSAAPRPSIRSWTS